MGGERNEGNRRLERGEGGDQEEEEAKGRGAAGEGERGRETGGREVWEGREKGCK